MKTTIMITQDIGSFSKSASLPFILTAPYVATLRDKILAEHLDQKYAPFSSEKDSPSLDVRMFMGMKMKTFK